MAIATVNPATGATLQTFDPPADSEVNAAIALAQETYESYRRVDFSQRSQWLNAAAEILTQERERWGYLMTLEMGKPIQSAIAEAEKCAWVCRYYAENAPAFLTDVPVETPAKNSFLRYQPLGIILAVMPWNFPFWQVFRFAAPTLMVGNVALLKHASNVPQCALAIAEIFERAGLPKGAFQTLLVPGSGVEAIVADDRVKAATLTGSEAAGSALAAAAGKYLKKTVLELGGSDPFIVLESADLASAAATGVAARTLNSGQSCIAAKRFIVAERIADEFERYFVKEMEALVVGDPMQASTQIGPLATPDILQELDAQVRATVASGAKVLCGGAPLDRPGNFYAPTILSEIPPDSSANHEEFFGPVALLYRVPNLDAAIALANATPFGLGASAWTQSEVERDRLVAELEAGAVFINSLVKSDPRLPFGGIKRSGYGRELAAQGLYEFANLKTVWID